MRKTAFQLVLGSLGLGLAACGGGDAAAGSGDAEPTALTDTGGAVNEPAEAGVAAAADSSGLADGAAGEAAGSAAAGDLTAYVGKFPAEAVGGVAWKDHPLVTAGIGKTVTDAAVRRAMQSPGGPTAPIATYEGKVGSWGCQQHNCGDHQWAVLVDPRSGATDVCYHNAEQTGESSRWFLADGSEETRSGNCSVV